MNNHFPPKFIIFSIAILFTLAGVTFAQEAKTNSSVESFSEIKQEQANKYRESGIECQKLGDLAQALSYYQKAIAVYPDFAVVYNDIGVVYEAMGSLGQAEENYLKASKIDPAYAGVYTNLALFYEGQRNLEKAEFYWNKRVQTGTPDDPWTQKAASRLSDIRMSLSGRPFSDEREEEVLGLMKEVVGDKIDSQKTGETTSQAHFKKAKQSFNKGDLATAIKEALDAQYLDQDNPEIEAFIAKAERSVLSR